MLGLLNRFLLFCSLFTCALSPVANGQTIQGEITDAADNKPVDGVLVSNIHTQTIKLSNKQGAFIIEAVPGQLIEFKKEGYTVWRIRLPQGKLPYFRVRMQKYNAAVPIFEETSPTYKADSIKYARIYKHELEYQQLKGIDAIEHPFSAMSKRNRQIWAFQKEYMKKQEQKYVDMEFSDKLIYDITRLAGDSLQVYKRLFRPKYEEWRDMGDYARFNYIKRTVNIYRKRGVKARTSNTRLNN
ncbi:MAG: hypothetical protein JST82_00005 [Bacteroidetes bacterium]|nr:hypothetical protein [Bacteroidota bacterium]